MVKFKNKKFNKSTRKYSRAPRKRKYNCKLKHKVIQQDKCIRRAKTEKLKIGKTTYFFLTATLSPHLSPGLQYPICSESKRKLSIVYLGRKREKVIQFSESRIYVTDLDCQTSHC